MDDTIYYIIRDKISGKYFKGSQGTGTSTFFTKRNTAPKLYNIGSAKSVCTQYNKYCNTQLDLEIIPVKICQVAQ